MDLAEIQVTYTGTVETMQSISGIRRDFTSVGTMQHSSSAEVSLAWQARHWPVGCRGISCGTIYLAAFIGGGASGLTLLYVPNPVASGAVGGLVTNSLQQYFDIRSGKQTGGFDYANLTVQTFAGGITGTFGKGGLRITRLPRTNKWNGLYLQMVTKWRNDTIRHVRPGTAGKMLAGRLYDSGGVHGAAATGLFNGLVPSFSGGTPQGGQASPDSGPSSGPDASADDPTTSDSSVDNTSSTTDNSVPADSLTMQGAPIDNSGFYDGMFMNNDPSAIADFANLGPGGGGDPIYDARPVKGE